MRYKPDLCIIRTYYYHEGGMTQLTCTDHAVVHHVCALLSMRRVSSSATQQLLRLQRLTQIVELHIYNRQRAQLAPLNGVTRRQ